PSFSGRIVPLFDTMLVQQGEGSVTPGQPLLSPPPCPVIQDQRLLPLLLKRAGEGSGTPTEPHHTSSSMAQTPSHTTQPTSSLPPVFTTSILTVTPTETTPIRQYTRGIDDVPTGSGSIPTAGPPCC
nr:hypothetical protein [Tanacetum cinerariifolium]